MKKTKKSLSQKDFSQDFSQEKNYKDYFLYGLMILFLVFSLFNYFSLQSLKKDVSSLKNIINPKPQAPQEVKIDDIKKLFSSDFIHFGDEKRKLLIVEVSDPSCPFCHIAGGLNPELAKETGRFQYVSDGGSYTPPVPEFKKLVDEGKASFAFLYSNGHGNGRLAAEAMYCAYEKNRFWEVHDKLMTNEGYKLTNDEVKNDKNNIDKLTSFLSSAIDPQFLTECLKEGKYESKLARDEKLTPSLGFQGTPHFLINAKMFQGAYSYSDMKQEIEKYL